MGSSDRNIPVLIFLFIFFLGGCGLTGNLVDWKGQKAFEDYIAEGQEKLSEMRDFIGKSHDDVLKAFGRPTDIISPAWFQKIRYDEEWYYKYDKGIPLLFPNEHTMSFYFNQGKVVFVDAL